ncbi:MAG: LptF/LptG family permease, partial [Crocinitomicaceae bacterium]|nr:LptF/LptG family permease [Crocinitomicaceae bacterium]
SIILELLFYVSASLIPLALPLAILLSSLIVMGNLGEYNELTALKASGMSIYRILRPLSFVVVGIAIATFYFANYVIPIANFKWHSIIWDIQETKLTSFLRPGSYTRDIDGYSIKISEGKGNKFGRIVIHDRTDLSSLKTITAQSGEFYRSETGDFLFFKLYDGRVIEELSKSPSYAEEPGKKPSGKTFPGRKATFRTATYKMNLTGFELNRTQDELFKNDFEMLNVFQINQTVDSLRANYRELTDNFVSNTKNKHEYFQAIAYDRAKPKKDEENNDGETEKAHGNNFMHNIIDDSVLDDSIVNDSVFQGNAIVKTISDRFIYTADSIHEGNRKQILEQLKTQLNANITSLNNQLMVEENKKMSLRKFEIEFHRKFSLSFSIIILFFIGAPLGAIVKKGGFGAPVVIAALLFMVYFVLITLGDGMAKQNVISPFWGMWGPNFVLIPFASILMISAANDRSITEIGSLRRRFKKWKRK